MKRWTRPPIRGTASASAGRRRRGSNDKSLNPKWYEWRLSIALGLCFMVCLSMVFAYALFALAPGLRAEAGAELRYLRAAHLASGELPLLLELNASRRNTTNATREYARLRGGDPNQWHPRDARRVVDHVLDHSLRLPVRLDGFETRLERYAVNLRILQERTRTLHSSVARQMRSLETRWRGNVTQTNSTMEAFRSKLSAVDANVTALSGPIQRAMHDYVKLTKERTDDLIKSRVKAETAPFETRIDALETLFAEIEERTRKAHAAAAKKRRGGYFG